MSYRTVIIGAAGAQFGAVVLGDIFSLPQMSGSEVILVDLNARALTERLEIAKEFVQSNNLDFKLTATTNRKEALAGADFVIISIETGDRFKLWEIDWRLPQQYGSRQVFGENGGVGGLLHGLRICPAILDIAADVTRICPQAWVFNFSNPMSRICTTVMRKFPDLRLIGMCHEIASLERYLPIMLDRKFESMTLRAGGLNHLSVLIQAIDKNSGKNLYPEILNKAKDFFKNLAGYSDIYNHYKKTGQVFETETAKGDDPAASIAAGRKWRDRGVFREILENFELLPITSDSHLGEYIGWAHDVADHRGIVDFFDYYSTVLCAGSFNLELIQKERFSSIIAGLIGGGDYEEAAVNIPNRGGLIENLPEWLVVEVPGSIGRGKIEGVKLDIPAQFRAILTNQIGLHDLVAEAVIKKSKKTALQAVLADPSIGIVRNAKDLLDSAIAKQSPYLDYLI